jgi:hypothetical protein
MTRAENTVVAAFAMPTGSNDLMSAANDPLTPPAVLWQIFDDHNSHDVLGMTECYSLAELAFNPALPVDLFSILLVKLKQAEDMLSVAPMPPMAYDFLSNFFLSPLTTFEQVLSIVCDSANLRDIVGLEELRSSRTVVELFDGLRPLLDFRHKYFMSMLLCSPLVSGEDFRARIDFKEQPLTLDLWNIVINSRFIPTPVDYERFLKALVDGSLSNSVRSIILNENASPAFLVEVLGHAEDGYVLSNWVYQNLNCPIELSASFHLKNLESYRWRPSYVLGLKLKLDEYLTSMQGEGPWEDLPLSWKLKMVASLYNA